MNTNNGARATTPSRIDQFGPVPTVRQQIFTLLICGAAMIFISGTMEYLGLL